MFKDILSSTQQQLKIQIYQQWDYQCHQADVKQPSNEVQWYYKSFLGAEYKTVAMFENH